MASSSTPTKCPTGAPYESLRFCQGQRVIPGVKSHVYYIAKRDKKWQVIELTLNKGNLEWETQGEQPSCTILNKFTISYPGTGEAAAAFCGMAVNDDLVYIVEQRDGKFRVLGNDMFNTVSKPKGSSGEGTSTNVGTEIEIEATYLYPAPFYTGEIDTVDGVINPTEAA